MIHQNHTLPVSVGRTGESRAWWSLDPNGKILLFIHGFGGCATKTWRFFPKLLVTDHAFSGCDLLFYGYDSRRVAALASATVLFDFLDPFLTNPSYLINHEVDLQRSWDFRHSEIYVVAHSLGAPIARKMLLRARERKSVWLPKVKMVFYAPATAGARAEQSARSAGSQGIFILTALYSWFSYNWPATDDLRRGSTFLTNLHSETDQVILSDVGAVFRSFGTFFGEHENVVDLKQELPWDSPYTIIPDKDHFSVCKPRKPQDAAYLNLKRLLAKQRSKITES
jgi:pimeloyl-ACP methyl ester carboxylesterase